MKFSIIIPVYNSSNYIIRCLDSIKKQIYNNFECIIIDDGSIDNTAELVHSWQSIDNGFIIQYGLNGYRIMVVNLTSSSGITTGALCKIRVFYIE